MKWWWALPLTLAAAGLVSAAPQRSETRSYVNVSGTMRPAFAWCDAPGRVIGVTQPASPSTGALRQPATLRRWLKRPQPESDAATLTARYLLGPSRGAAGSIYTQLSFPDGNEQDSRYFIHTSNVEDVQDSAYRMTRVNEFRTPEGEFRCRYQPQAVFMGATAKRTVIIWESGGKLTYATRNFDGTPGVSATGGKLLHTADMFRVDGQHDFKRWYAWEAEADDAYDLSVSQSGAVLNIREGGRMVQTEPFLAYSVSLHRR